jgi:hypothetical protein
MFLCEFFAGRDVLEASLWEVLLRGTSSSEEVSGLVEGDGQVVEAGFDVDEGVTILSAGLLEETCFVAKRSEEETWGRCD